MIRKQDLDESRVELDEGETGGHVVVPWERLGEEAQRGVIVEFVTREGTEYGEREVSLEQKIEQVRAQLERGEIVLTFDVRSESVNLSVAKPRRR